jgi:hypothetical protein
VLEDVKASELPAAWRKRIKAKAEERVTVTIAKRATKRITRAAAEEKIAARQPNASFGMWADRTDLDPVAHVRALRQPRYTR